jgi:hypothetical protein
MSGDSALDRIGHEVLRGVETAVVAGEGGT